MASYNATKQSLVRERLMAVITGIPLEGGPFRDWFPIRPCVCVTAENCPCDTLDDVILWLPSGTASEKTGDRWQGEDVLAYPIPRGSKVILEAQIPITVGDLQLMKDLAERGRGRAVTVFQKSANTTKGKPSIGALLIGAFELGWHIGEKIDEETGASDKISDWLAENFPWPW